MVLKSIPYTLIPNTQQPPPKSPPTHSLALSPSQLKRVTFVPHNYLAKGHGQCHKVNDDLKREYDEGVRKCGGFASQGRANGEDIGNGGSP
jgi:hypothetical protein